MFQCKLLRGDIKWFLWNNLGKVFGSSLSTLTLIGLVLSASYLTSKADHEMGPTNNHTRAITWELEIIVPEYGSMDVL